MTMLAVALGIGAIVVLQILKSRETDPPLEFSDWQDWDWPNEFSDWTVDVEWQER